MASPRRRGQLRVHRGTCPLHPDELVLMQPLSSPASSPSNSLLNITPSRSSSSSSPSRHPPPPSTPPADSPGFQFRSFAFGTNITADHLPILRDHFPHLSSLPDSFFLSTPMEVLTKMESNAMKKLSLEKGKNLEDKILANQDTMVPILVKEGFCNRREALHPARFLPAPICSAQELWLQAREVIGPAGIPPVANYDLASVGLSGYVTTRGWVEIHNPGSSSMALKLFSMANVNNKVAATRRISLANNEDTLEVGDSLKEVCDLQEFQRALRAAREAMAFALPWNHSVAALEGFLASSNFLAKPLGGKTNRVSILTNFVDHVFALNGDRWRNKQGFLTVLELSSLWSIWAAGRVEADKENSAPGNPHPKGQGNKSSKSSKGPSQGGKQAASQSQPPRPKPAGSINQAPDLCRRYNFGICPNPDNNCLTAAGVKLKHICNHLDPVTSAKCTQAHIRIRHH